MISSWVIDRLRKEETRDDRPRVYLPVETDYTQKGEEKKDCPQRGVVVIKIGDEDDESQES
jgi:hypothetical protein